VTSENTFLDNCLFSRQVKITTGYYYWCDLCHRIKCENIWCLCKP